MNLEELANAELGPGTREGRAEFLRNCQGISRTFGIDEVKAESIVGSLYWLVVRRLLEPGLRWLGGYPATDPRLVTGDRRQFIGPSNRAEPLVVAHGEPVRFSLVLLDPNFRHGRPQAQEIAPDIAVEAIESEFGDEFDDPSNRLGRASIQRVVLNFLEVLASAQMRLHPFMLVDQFREALLAYATVQPGGVVVVRRPRLERTSGLVPAAPVRSQAGEISTAGMLFEVSQHELLITAANHAVTDDLVEVAGIPADVVVRHGGTDSCVLRVPYTPDCPLFTRARQLRHHRAQALPPRPHEDASFVGATSGPVNTTIRAHDPSILFRMPEFASKLYTDCDTVDGDSGAALYDSGGKVMGFATYRTAYGEDPSYSVWIWAKQVLEQHKLDRL